MLDGSAGAATAGDELDGAASDDDAFSDALSRQASLGASDCGEALPAAGGGGEQPPREAEPPATPALEAAAVAPAARRSGKPLLQRVMQALKQQGHLDAAALQQQPGDGGAGSGPVGAGQPPATDPPAAAEQQRQRQQWGFALPRGAEELHGLFVEHHAREWMPRVAAAWGYTWGGCRRLAGWGSPCTRIASGQAAGAGALAMLA